MAHGFAGYSDGRNNKGYTEAFWKMAKNRGPGLAKRGAKDTWGFGKELYQKLKNKFGKRKNQSVALVAQHSTSEVVPVSVHQVGNTSSIFGNTGLSGFMRGANRGGGIDPDVMGGGLANFASPRRMNKGYDIIDISPVNSSKESDPNIMPMSGGGGGSLLGVETAIYDLTREVNETKMAMVNIATRQMQQADILAANQNAMQERALMAQQHTLSPSFSGTTGTNSSALKKPKRGRGGMGIPIPMRRGGGTGSIMKRGSKRGLTRAAAKIGGKGLAKKAAKFGAKTAGKQIPGLGLLMGGGLGLARLMKGDVLGALSEVTQGALTTFAPGVGNAVALGLDMVTPAMADGGVVQSPTTALIGEDGPELVQPLNKEAYKVMGDGLLDAWTNRKLEIHRFISGGMKLYQKEEGRYLSGNGNGTPGTGQPGGKGWYGHDIPENAPRGPARLFTGLWDAMTFDLFDTDKRGSIWENEHGQSKGVGRWLQGGADWLTGDRFDFDRRDENAPASAVKAENDMLGKKPPNRSSIMKYVKNKGISDKRAKLIAQSGDSAPSSTGGMFDLNTTDFAAMKSAVPDWSTNWQAQVDWVMNSGKLDSYIKANKPEGLLQSISNIFTGGDKTEGEKLNTSSAETSLSGVKSQTENVIIMPEIKTPNTGTVSGGITTPGISFADTGMEVFANLKIRTIR